MKVFFTYIDWTLEASPRVFYVGKGDDRRIKQRERNAYWKRIAAKYGWRREVVFGTREEQAALDFEIQLIAEYKTYTYDNHDRWGCNFTRGGEGISGYCHTEFARARIGDASRGAKNGFYGKRHTTDCRQMISERTSEAMVGVPKTAATRVKMKVAAARRTPNHYAVLHERSKPVECLTLEGEFVAEYKSAAEAVSLSHSRFTHSGISEACHDKVKTHRGLVWRFKL